MTIRGFLALAAVLVAPIAQAAELVVADDMIACRNRDTIERLSRFAAVRPPDGEAFKKLADAGLASGECSRLVVGVAVFVEERTAGLVCLRPRGDTRCAWTWREAAK